MAVLNLQVLGGFKALNEVGQEIIISARKGRALLAVLAVSPSGAASREKLAALLWSDRGEEQARSSLRQTLTVLRKELGVVGANLLVADDQRVELARGTMEIDAVSIISLSKTNDAPALQRAVNLYHGEFLADGSIGDPMFEEWLAGERSRFRDLMISILDRLLTLEPAVARVALAKRLLALDPLREASHLFLMNAYADSGERSMALQQYSACRDLLKSELNVQPGKEIEQLRQRLTTEEPTVSLPSQSVSSPPSQNRDPKLQVKPSIAVLTFTNLSSDPAQRYFSDGITADIVTELSRFHQLLVRAHRPANDGLNADALTTGRELGAHFVTEGSVRRLGKRIRITVQLLDVESGGTLWSERFDADEEDIFSTQDKIVRSIVAQLFGRLQLANLEKASRKPPNSMAAYDYVLRGHALPVGVPEAEAEARRLFQKAIDIDPGYARAYASLGSYHIFEWSRDLDTSAATLDRSLELTKKAVALDDGDDFCHAMLGRVHMFRRDHELADYHFQKALAINPNSPSLMAGLGILYGFRGEPERGLDYFREALAIAPHFDPTWYWRNRAVVHFIAHEYEEAIEGFRRSPIQPDWVEAYLAASHAHLGQMDKARKHAVAALHLTPQFTIQALLAVDPFRRREDAEHLADGLRKAGIP
ncbi:MAG TPA: BTAD domain-containing putative transcriptional regulator [Aestuariivirga sp.]|nr:BTAD domain-containing putative transcriptional regulator [Aestuariivirga sp.]